MSFAESSRARGNPQSRKPVEKERGASRWLTIDIYIWSSGITLQVVSVTAFVKYDKTIIYCKGNDGIDGNKNEFVTVNKFLKEEIPSSTVQKLMLAH